MKLFHILVIFTLVSTLSFVSSIFSPTRSSSSPFSIAAIHSKIQSGEAKCSDIIDYFLDRAYAYNKNLNAIISFNPTARLDAKYLDEYFENNTRSKHNPRPTNAGFIGKLHCVPTIIKDNIDIKGMPTTGGIKPLRYSIPNQDATIVKRLKAQGAILLGKSNLAELAHGPENSETGGQCHNPFDYVKSCGASSTGSGASISSALAILSVGTDTDGSILVPASFNGIYGLRTRRNEPPVEGIIPLMLRQDTVGPFAKHINDMVLAYSVMQDNSSVYDDFVARKTSSDSLRVSYLSLFFNSFNATPVSYIIDDEVKAKAQASLTKMKSLNINVSEIVFTQNDFIEIAQVLWPISQSGKPCIIGCTKQAYNEYFGYTERFQSDASTREFNDLLNSPLLSQYWRDELNMSSTMNDPNATCLQSCASYDALKVQFINLVNTWFEKYNADVIVVPTSGVLPYNTGSKFTDLTSFTIMASLSNSLAFNMPIGYSRPTAQAPDGYPIGLMLVARSDRIVQAFQVARVMEAAFDNSKLPSSTPLLNNQPSTWYDGIKNFFNGIASFFRKNKD